MTEVERYAIAGELRTLEEAYALLERAGNPQAVKRIADYAEAMRFAAQQAKMGHEAQNEAAELKIWALHKLGRMLSESVQHQGGRPPKTVSGGDTVYE